MICALTIKPTPLLQLWGVNLRPYFRHNCAICIVGRTPPTHITSGLVEDWHGRSVLVVERGATARMRSYGAYLLDPRLVSIKFASPAESPQR